MAETTTPRMLQLQKLLQREPNDPFLVYGLALEYKKIGDLTRAIEHLNRVVEIDPGYCYAYHQKGLAYEQAGNTDLAKSAYQDGIEAATKKGDEHARQEIEAALKMVE